MYTQIASIIRQAGQYLLQARDIAESVREKSSACDLVTKYDPMVEDFLRQNLLAAFPEAGFFGEEEHEHHIRGKRSVFIVDPIDGTTNFIRALHHSCISVGLLQDGAMQYAAVFNPYLDELFTAERGKGAFLNGKPIHVTDATTERSLVLWGSAIYYRETVPATVRFVEKLFPQVLDFRRGGSAALDLCYLAAGKADLFFECCLQPWDYAAGSLIVQEAGGVVTSLSGKPLNFFRRCSVAAGNPVNHPQLLALASEIDSEPNMKGRIQ